MNFYIRLLFALPVLCVAACSAEREDEAFAPSDKIEFQVSVSARSRVVLQDDGSGAFRKGDEVALWKYDARPDKIEDKHLLHCEGDRWTSSLYWKEEQGSSHFYAAWPSATQLVLRNGGCRYAHRVAQDQSSEEGLLSSELLVADAVAGRLLPVRLDFRHAMSRVMVRLSRPDGSLPGEDLSGMKVYVRGFLSGTYDLSAGGTEADGEPGWIQTHAMAEKGSFEVLVFPGDLKRFREGGWIKIVSGGKEVLFNAPESVGDSLESGKQVKINLQLESGEAVPEEPVWWTAGIKPSDGWLFDDPVYRMPWTNGCGWFDCNKLDASSIGPQGDGLTCWEASSSNLMHWWMSVNSDYVQRFLEYKRKQVPDFVIPSAYPDSKHSEIYQRFKSHFGNRGGYIVSGVNWFLSGICKQTMYPQDTPELDGAGFFWEVFGRKSLATQYGNGYISKEEFNKAMKTARQKEMAVGLDIFIKGGGHAVNLWGAEWNDEGEVGVIYLVDNNDGRMDDRVYKAKIVYVQEEPGGPSMAYLKWMYNENLLVKITDLVLVEKGTVYWEAFFNGQNGSGSE